MYHSTSVIPKPGEIRAELGGPRSINFGSDRYLEDVTVHVPSRAVLDALQAALDAIRADMDVKAAAEPEAVTS